MSQNYVVQKVTGATTPATVEVVGNWLNIFKPSRWVDPDTLVETIYDPLASQPAGTVFVPATTFNVGGITGTPAQVALNGRYEVKTGLTLNDTVSFAAGVTTVQVDEIVPPTSEADGAQVTDARVSNVSVYRIVVDGGSDIIIQPVLTDETSTTLTLSARSTRGWGEELTQNLVDITQSFSGPTPPGAPLRGQLWFDTGAGTLNVWDGSAWQLVGGTGASSMKYTHTQASPQTVWNIVHNLNVPSPFIVEASFVVLESGLYKPILPFDVTYLDANTISVNFTGPQEGFAIVRS